MRRLAAALLLSTAIFAAEANVPPPPPDAAGAPATPVQLPPGASANAAGLIAMITYMMDMDVAYEAEVTDKPGVVGLLNVTLTERVPPGSKRSPSTTRIARIEAVGFDADAAAQLATATPDQPMRKIADRIEMTDVETAAGFLVARAASSTVEGLEMKPAAFRFKPADDAPTTPEQALANLMNAVKALGHIADSARFASASARDMTLEVDFGALGSRVAESNPGMAPIYPDGTKATYRIGEYSQNGYDRGRFGRGTVKAMSVEMTYPQLGDITMTMRESWLDGWDISKLVPSLIAGQWPPITREALLGYGAGCTYDTVLRIPRIGEFSVPEYCMDAIEFTYLMPKALDFTISGTFTPAPGGEFAAPPYVAKYFTQPLDFSILFGATYDADSGVAAMTHYGVRLEEFGSVDFKVAGGGFGLEGLPLLPSNYQQTLSLVSGEVELVDEGGVAKFLDIAATMQTEAAGEGGAAVTPDALKMQAVMGVNMMVGALGNTPEAAAMGEAMRNFLDKGGRLRVGVKPPKPMVSADFTGLTGKPPAEIVGTVGAYATWTAP